MPKISLSMLMLVFARLVGRVPYRYGAKAPGRLCDTSEISEIDCSGLVDYLLSRATDGRLELPDGSVDMHEWAESHLRRLARYSDVQYAAGDPSRLFLCFIAPGAEGEGSAGHVWLVRAGKTLESHGHTTGVSSRPWDYSTLLDYACAAYELPTGA